MARKERLTVTVDANLVEAGNQAVAAGRADSLSGWVNLALAEREAKERRLLAMAQAVAEYEARFGEISPEEIAAQQRADQKAAIVVRGPRRARTRTTRTRGRAA
jgi:nucleotide-binding universal stress UspA family protein